MVLTLDYANQFLLAKIWAILHDPPHKAWSRNHEKEAKEIMQNVFAETFYGGGVPGDIVEEIVRRADIAAASFDRWLLMKTRTEWVNYHNILNIFDPRIKAYKVDLVENFPQESLESFKRELKSTIKYFKENPTLLYHIFFSTVEYIWGRSAERVSPADTRFPTQTVFDHTYATASMVNWYLSGEEPSGFLVYLDIPGIQSFIKESRKTHDYWAGSYLVSYIMLKILEPLLKVLGPDIMLLPTARHNLMYKQWLIADFMPKYIRQEIKATAATKLVTIWGNLYVPSLQPVMPGTVSIALPKLGEKVLLKNDLPEKLKESEISKLLLEVNEALKDKESIKKYLYRLFNESWRNIVDKIASLRDSDKTVCKLAKIIVEEYYDFFKELPLNLLTVVIDIEEVYKKYVVEASSDFSILEEILSKEAVSKLKEVVKEISREFALSEIDVLRKLFYFMLFSKILGKEIKSIKIKYAMLPTYTKLLSITSDYSSFVEKYSDKVFSIAKIDNKIWRYCSVCGCLPAIIRFPLDEREYEKELKKIYSSEIDFNEIKSFFKLGESLCPRCFIKRIFKFLVEESLDKSIIEANAIQSPKIYPVDTIANKYLLESLREINIPDEFEILKKALNSFNEKEERFSYDYLVFSLKSEGRELERGEVKLELDRQLSSLLKNKKIEDDFLRVHKFRDYYAIIEGDGDSMGKIVNGCLYLSPEKYLDLVVDNIKEAIPEKDLVLYKKFKEAVLKLINAFKQDSALSEITVIISPSYHSSLSAALMVTAVKDIATITTKLRGIVVYSGGDDISALVPVEYALRAVYETRKNYWAIEGDIFGFHKYFKGSLVVPAAIAYGRSYDVRIAHVMDPMQSEIDIAAHLLKKAKNYKWINLRGDSGFEKDTLIFSYGRATAGEPLEAKLPLREDFLRLFNLIEELWRKMLSEKISKNMPADYFEIYSEPISQVTLLKLEYPDDLISSLLSRNIKQGSKGEVDSIVKGLKECKVYDYCCILKESKEECCKEGLLINNLFKLIYMLRSLPR